jgi:hypothetical protein
VFSKKATKIDEIFIMDLTLQMLFDENSSITWFETTTLPKAEILSGKNTRAFLVS